MRMPLRLGPLAGQGSKSTNLLFRYTFSKKPTTTKDVSLFINSFSVAASSFFWIFTFISFWKIPILTTNVQFIRLKPPSIYSLYIVVKSCEKCTSPKDLAQQMQLFVLQEKWVDQRRKSSLEVWNRRNWGKRGNVFFLFYFCPFLWDRLLGLPRVFVSAVFVRCFTLQ